MRGIKPSSANCTKVRELLVIGASEVLSAFVIKNPTASNIASGPPSAVNDLLSAAMVRWEFNGSGPMIPNQIIGNVMKVRPLMSALAMSARFRDFVFEGKKITFFHAFSAEEAKRIMKAHPEISLILLDVVMETETAGLDFVKHLRQDLKNKLVRVILRTGEPGHAPEQRVIIDYDINDYKEKTELTIDKFYTAVIGSLRSFKDLKALDESKNMIEDIAVSMNRFIPHAFFKLLNKENILQINLGDCTELEMTIMFLDIESFTKISESLPPMECFKFINMLLGHLEPIIIKHKGFIDKYVGDAIMSLYEGEPDQAILSALKMFESLQNLNDSFKQKNKEPINIRIGINCGSLAIGTVGFHDRMDFTAISDTVNIAARLEKLNRTFGTHLLITEQTLAKLKHPKKFSYRRLGKVTLKGRKNSTIIYEIFDSDKPELKKLKIKTKSEFEKATLLYEENKYDAAYALFKNIVRLNPKDNVAKTFLKMCQTAIQH